MNSLNEHAIKARIIVIYYTAFFHLACLCTHDAVLMRHNWWWKLIWHSLCIVLCAVLMSYPHFKCESLSWGQAEVIGWFADKPFSSWE